MKNLTVTFSERRNHSYATDGENLLKFNLENSIFEIQTRLPHELSYQIAEILKYGETFENTDLAIEFVKEAFAKSEANHLIKKAANKIIQAEFEASLSDFWKDVDSRSGMDVCTPFKNKMIGLGFVAYDAGFVWCKDTKTAYLLRDFKSIAYLPKTYKSVVRFGEEF